MKKKLIIGLIVIVGLAIGVNACNKDNKPTKVGENTKTEQKQEQQKTEFKIGEAIKLDGMVLTVTDVQKSQGGEFDKPKSGNEFVTIHVKIENKGDKTISYNPMYFKLKNSQGQITDETFATTNQDTALHSGDLAQGGNVTGSIIFEAPKSDKNLQLLFQDNIFTKDSKITINLNK